MRLFYFIFIFIYLDMKKYYRFKSLMFIGNYFFSVIYCVLKFYVRKKNKVVLFILKMGCFLEF